MQKPLLFKILSPKTFLIISLLVSSLGNAQYIMQVNILGGDIINPTDIISIDAGSSLTFRVTNVIEVGCGDLRIRSISISDPENFSISNTNPTNVKPEGCKGNNYFDFTVTATGTDCITYSTDIVITTNTSDTITFTFKVIKSPIISVLGGSPLADVMDGATTTTATNGTYFGVVEVGLSKTRDFIIVNTGSCALDISGITSTGSSIDAITDLPHTNFSVTPYVLKPIYPPTYPYYSPAGFPASIEPGYFAILKVTFTAGDPANNEAIISITNNTAPETDLFTFTVRAEVFEVTDIGPGGVTADFRLWLKATRGIVKDGSDMVSLWKDLGSNGKDAEQETPANQPTYKDDPVSNINFNPVIKFENDGISLNQYLENADNGFYSQDIFIVMEPNPDVDVASSSKMTIFSGTVSNYTNNRGAFSGNANYDNDGDANMNNDDTDDLNLADDVTSIGLGNLHSIERLWYNQGSATSNPFYNLEASSSRSYAKAGIINAHNYSDTPSDGMRILYNSFDDANTATKEPASLVFDNVGYIEDIPDDDDIVWGTPYKIGKNAHDTYGNLNGRVAEIMTFAQRVPDDGDSRQKIETYLAIKYGITLGETEASKNYINSNYDRNLDVEYGIIWNYSINNGFNFNVAGIGRDDSSDLNQKQSKSVNDANEVTIGLGLIAATNNANVNEFENDGDFLVWGCNNLEFTGASANTVTIATEITTSLIRIDRKWKIVESGGDVENIYIGIPSAAFTDAGFNLSTIVNEEYVLIVSDTKDFNNEDIIDVIPLKASGTNWQTWYDFDGTKYFTFGKAPKLTGNRSINIKTGDYLVGEYALNININAFTISAWIRSVPSSAGTDPRTIMAKGSKLQLRLNSDNKIEVVLEDVIIFTSTPEMALDDSKWHQITFVYQSGTIFLYIDGILDKSVQGVNPPTPNYNHFSLGALYVSKGSGISNPFLGEIDEVYVWDQGLTQDQIRYLMNQEIERFDVGDTDYANGKVLPQAAASNEVTTIPWSKLRAYYDFNSFYGSTVEGLTNDRNFLRIKYLKKDKQIVEDQTAPLPYVSAADAVANPLPVWGDETTWVNGAAQNPPNSKGLDGSTYIDWNIVETSHDITSGDRDDIGITVLGLISTAGTLTIANPNETLDETNSGYGLRVTNYLEMDGIIDLVGESQLLQDEGSILDQDSGGYIERDQQGTANSFNYNYWSSSVGPKALTGTSTRGTGMASLNTSFTIKGIINDGRSANPPIISYGTSPHAANAVPGNQLTISSYWFYQFYGKDDDYNSWFPRINENSPLAPGMGYTMKGSSGAAAIANQQNYVFKGKPYNGTIKLNLKRDDPKFAISLVNVDRLIGNPYPSALDANEFILDNIKTTTETLNGEVGRNAVNVFNGALYFWDHFGEVNSHNLGAYVGGYATYTLMGGVQAIADDARINTTSGILSSKIPERYIPVGQGFFVITALDAALVGETTTTVEGGTITFKNSQRYFKREGSSPETENTGSVFMKNSNSKTAQSSGGKETAETYEEEDLRPKIRLLFHSPKGYNRQLLIGADENTTNNFDIGYDGLIADTGNEDMFWMIQNAKFVIQGVPNFNTDHEFPLGIKIAKAGLATIKIDALENMDENLSAHIKDKLTGEIHNISQKHFEINLEPGTYLDRFVLIFKMQKLVAEDVVAEVLIPAEMQPIIEGIHVFMNNDIKELQIKNNNDDEILNIELYNYLGQTIKIWNSNFKIRTISLPVNIATGVYLVQINTKTGSEVQKVVVE